MAVKSVPDTDTHTTVTPQLIVKDCDTLLDFMKAAFAAQVTDVHRDPNGRVLHADVTIVTNYLYGDRSGGVEDPSGVTWWISTHVEDVSPEEMEQRMKAGQPA